MWPTLAALSMRQPSCDLSQPASDVCQAYCTNQCAFYNESAERGQPFNITLYRITPANVTGLRNKNTGDDVGDVNFFLMRKNMSMECAASPSGWGCFLDGDNVYGKFVVEVCAKIG